MGLAFSYVASAPGNWAAPFGSKGKDTLRNALRTDLGAQGRMREVRSIETRCLGICPKKAMTAINASAPRIMTVPTNSANLLG